MTSKKFSQVALARNLFAFNPNWITNKSYKYFKSILIMTLTNFVRGIAAPIAAEKGEIW